MCAMSSSAQPTKGITNNGEIDWNAQRDGVFVRLHVLVPCSKSISYYVGFVACYLWCTRKVDRKITLFEWLKWMKKEKNIINVFIHEEMSFLGSRTRRGFLWFHWLGDMTSRDSLREGKNFHKNVNPVSLFKKLELFSSFFLMDDSDKHIILIKKKSFCSKTTSPINSQWNVSACEKWNFLLIFF